MEKEKHDGGDQIESKDASNDPITKKEEDEKIDETEEEGSDIMALKSSLDEKTKQADEYYDRLLRTQAEFENYKKRTEKEICDFKTYANAQLVKDLLVVLDDFQNALAQEDKNANGKFSEGMEMIYRNLYEVLEKEGLCEITAENEKFDPWKHEAVEMVPTNDYPEHTVMGVVQKGYEFKDKVLRPAKVRVAALPRSEEKNEGTEEDKETIENQE